MASSRYEPQTIEHKVKEFWDSINLRKKILKMGKKDYYFLDGPPYMNGPPHVGHARTRAIRDPILKYKTMRGYRVRLQPGYDCHGLPIEVAVEGDLGVRHKSEILDYGLGKFIEKCKERANRFVKVFNDFWDRMGMHWDYEHPYLTLTNEYIESSWFFFRKAHEKNLLYKGLATVIWCPRCETPLAGYEATDEYRERTDTSIYLKFRVKGKENTYFIIWTTTPWTIPANVAIALNPKYAYAKVKVRGETWILAKELLPKILKKLEIPEEEAKMIEEVEGKALEGTRYEPPLPDEVPMQRTFKNAYRIILADWVTLDEGTGCVHTAPGHGGDDYNAGVKYKLPVFSPVDERGNYTEEAGKYAGKFVFDANRLVIHDLHERKTLLLEEEIKHSYPHCWRCKHPLVFRASKQWFIKIDPIKEKMLKFNEKIKWIPEYAGAKRFKDWIANARDWCISRQRFWGIPMPIWVCDNCNAYEVFSTYEEVEKRANFIPSGDMDLHRPWIDNIQITCEKCRGKMKRVPDVADVWFDSGAASWASLGYPKNTESFKRLFPADFITEGLDQTRGWFYTLLFESIVAFDQSSYKKVLMNGFVLDHNGEKMSKSKGNVVEPMEVIDKYGADVLRYYLLWETQVWEALKFNYENVDQVYRAFNILWNVSNYVKKQYRLSEVSIEKLYERPEKLELEDNWIISRANTLLKEVTQELEDTNNLYTATRKIKDFIVEDLSRWYVKLVRDRVTEEKGLRIRFSNNERMRLPLDTFKTKKTEFMPGDTVELARDVGEHETGERASVAERYKVLNRDAVFYTLKYAMGMLSYVLAPFAPYLAEVMYQRFGKTQEAASVHLAPWPEADGSLIDTTLEEEMLIAREIVESVLSIRQKVGIKLRTPLSGATVVTNESSCLNVVKKMPGIIEKMANLKQVVSDVSAPGNQENISFSGGKLYLDTKLTKELRTEGNVRDIIRAVQALRKDKKLNESDVINLNIVSDEAIDLGTFEDKLKEETNTRDLHITQEQFITGELREARYSGKKIGIVVSPVALEEEEEGEYSKETVKDVIGRVMKHITKLDRKPEELDVDAIAEELAMEEDLDKDAVKTIIEEVKKGGVPEETEQLDRLTSQLVRSYSSRYATTAEGVYGEDLVKRAVVLLAARLTEAMRAGTRPDTRKIIKDVAGKLNVESVFISTLLSLVGKADVMDVNIGNTDIVSRRIYEKYIRAPKRAEKEVEELFSLVTPEEAVRMAKEKADTDKKKSQKLLEDAKKMLSKKEKKGTRKFKTIYLMAVPLIGLVIVVLLGIPEIGIAISEEASIEIIMLILTSIFMVLVLGGLLIANLSKRRR